jgi:acylphosphatase
MKSPSRISIIVDPTRCIKRMLPSPMKSPLMILGSGGAAARLYANILSMSARAHILVSGRVQGVFYRDHTRRWAISLGLKGWVRNLYDGRVELIAEGEKPKIEGLIRLLWEGPPMARVENIEVRWENYKGEFEDFRIALMDF